jgi:septal ring factor EnvC (AmiA/AmiB activator)
VALCAAALVAVPVAAADGDAAIKRKAELLERVRARIAELSQTIEHDRSRRDSLEAQLEAAERAVQKARSDLDDITAKVDRQTAKVNDVEAQHADAKRKLESERAALAAQVRAAYVVGSGGAAELALGQADPGRVERMLGYYDYLDRARAQRVARIDDELREVTALEQQLRDEQKSLQQLQDQHRSAYNDLQQRRADRGQALAAIKRRMAGETEQLQQLRTSERDLESLLASLRKAMEAAPALPGGPALPFPKMKGRLQWPLRGPLLADYGDPKAGGRLEWRGLWIGADEGTPVRACARGRVAYVGWMSRYGLIVVIEHEDGYFSLYGHASTADVATGDAVQAGQVIAAAGTTGGYERPGLYFEIRKGIDPVNPHHWLGR